MVDYIQKHREHFTGANQHQATVMKCFFIEITKQQMKLATFVFYFKLR